MFTWILKEKHIKRTHFYHSVFVIAVAVAVIVRSFWLLRCRMTCLVFDDYKKKTKKRQLVNCWANRIAAHSRAISICRNKFVSVYVCYTHFSWSWPKEVRPLAFKPVCISSPLLNYKETRTYQTTTTIF